MEEKIAIPVSKAKILLLFIGSSIFVVLGVWILLATNADLFHKVAAFFAILFFGLGFFIFPQMLLDRTPGVVIDRYGITDNITKPRVGTLEWEDISHVQIYKIHSNKMLFIFVHNPDKYLDRVKGFNYKGLRNNYAMVGTPFVIPSSVLKMKLEVLEALINKEIAKHAGQSKRNNML